MKIGKHIEINYTISDLCLARIKRDTHSKVYYLILDEWTALQTQIKHHIYDRIYERYFPVFPVTYVGFRNIQHNV